MRTAGPGEPATTGLSRFFGAALFMLMLAVVLVVTLARGGMA
jgi:hypothetical protein